MNIINKVTLKTLWKNKVRTLVTIIGIILSASMITAVTTSISSIQNYMLEMVIEMDGDWHGSARSIPAEKITELGDNSEVENITTLQNIGYALIEDSMNESKPYLFIGGMDKTFSDIMPVRLTAGRLPSNSSEIIIPNHIETNGGVKYKTGDILNLDIGNRISEGESLSQHISFLNDDGNAGEEILDIKEQRSFTVVGFYERPNFEEYSAPGYTALTLDDGEKTYSYDVYLKIKQPKNIFVFMDSTFTDYGHTTNNDYLRFSGISDDIGFNSVFYSLAAILIGIIVFGSISLIYNAFSISVSERTKQFGLLSSVGATKKQMKSGVLFEAFALSIVGIPFGILAGILGIGVTFSLTQDLFTSFIGNNRTETAFHLSVSWQAVAIAALIGLLTVLISAYIPAKRALNVSAIDAIRQSKDIRIKTNKVKTSKLVYKLFGFEGMMARKNFKRNKKKYRATVVSLFLSIVLFISASSFSAYLKESTSRVIEPAGYDITYTYTPDLLETYPAEEIFNELTNLKGVEDSSYTIIKYPYYSEILTDDLSPEYKEYAKTSLNNEFSVGQYTYAHVISYFINDKAYEKYIRENSFDLGVHLDRNNPLPVVIDYSRIFNFNEGRFYTLRLLKNDLAQLNIRQFKEIGEFYLTGETFIKDGVQIYVYSDNKENRKEFTVNEAATEYNIDIGTLTEKKPFSMETNQELQLSLLYPYSALKAVTGEDYKDFHVTMYFKAKDHKDLYEKIYKVLSGKGLNTSRLFDYAETKETDRAIITVIDVFSYGFIVLISLIAAANVFNTISTNIGLRRHEFAMLKSIGMTQKMFKKMMNFECLLYGIKGLLYGIPVSIGVTYLIYRGISNGLETGFFIPWYSIVIAVGSVFAVVFATMLYSMDKIKKDNPIDALKDENL